MFVYDQADDVEKIVAALPGIGPQLTAAATEVRKKARTVFPMSRSAARKKSLVVYRSRLVNYRGAEVQAAFVASWDRLAIIFEFGSIKSPPYRPLSAALEASGLEGIEWTDGDGSVAFL